MRLLADENVERELVELLRAMGHDVAWGQVVHPQWSDPRVLQLARGEKRVLVTEDKDFGELVYARGLATTGVILLRFSSDDVGVNAAILRRAMPEIERSGEGHFAVVTDRRVRIRPLGISPQEEAVDE